MTRTVDWPEALVWKLVFRGIHALGSPDTADLNAASGKVIHLMERSRRTGEVLNQIIGSRKYSLAVRRELAYWHDDLIEYRQGALDAALIFADAHIKAHGRDEALAREFEDWRSTEPIQRAISEELFDREFGA